MTSSEKPEPQGSEPSSTDDPRCGECGEPIHFPARTMQSAQRWEHVGHSGHAAVPPKAVLFEEYERCPPACAEGHAYSGSCMLRAYGPGDPPMTPEEEEEVPEDQGCQWPSCLSKERQRALAEEVVREMEGLALKPEGLCEIPHATIAEEEVCDREHPASALPPPEGPEYTPCVSCGHIEPEHVPDGGPCLGADKVCDCPAYRTQPESEDTWPCGDCGAEVPASQDWCSAPDCQEKARAALAAGAPPQPERRPPYVATYSVGGHLYEVALSGDASLEAVDGVLVIRHGLGPVAALVGVQPMKVEEK